MIIKDLYDLYERYVADPEMQSEVPLEGMSVEKVFWEIVLSEDGELKNVRSLSWGDGKNGNEYRVMHVPRPLNERRSSDVTPYFLCDTAEYLFGLGGAKKKHSKSRELHENVLKGCNDFAADAVRRFFSQNLPMGEWDAKRLEDTLSFRKASNKSNLLVFYIENSVGEGVFVHECPSVIDAWNCYRAENPESNTIGQCSVTGEKVALAHVFLPLTGFPGAQPARASLISFNCESFCSYGEKIKEHTIGVSERVAFGAGSTLRKLLSDPEHNVRFGDKTDKRTTNTIFVFWSDRPAPDEDALFRAFIQPPSEDDATIKRVQDALDNIKNGNSFGESFDANVRYYVLGISPNAARLSVRFFETATFGKLAVYHGQYLQDIDMIGVRTTSLLQLIRQCAVQGKYKNIPSTLVNPCMQAMLTGSRFPRSLLSTLLSRMRTDHGSYELNGKPYEVTGQRVSLIKACLVRARRFSGVSLTRENEVDMSLNRENNSIGYLLGRLFAVMEKAQEDAVKPDTDDELNATIRDKYIGSASVTPARVMPTLMHGCQNHLSILRKKRPGLNYILERELDEIVGGKLSDEPYPRTLSMEEQGEFFIGYYQERREGFRSSHKQDDGASDETTSNDSSEN
ncbi:type I-C CRISPR-associated protein Cas8c/Csd1 [Atopobium sp. oral taxon 810]|uniref:type I-C CRISPR-associated protein Cas8c/Csd1 n=1 Tax=Atopobium sp. oral taxon 810 TaxID=712158 RepID=UPI000396792A|nr:type I-C CRISPR-associated protein Cas8c/Csd1 [Atopobium sp. oral taxon 810]ERI04266.1 CRISPR-associated protein, Csd1 family [Atopobium sp. oral taxon 810 str. F0209]